MSLHRGPLHNSPVSPAQPFASTDLISQANANIGNAVLLLRAADAEAARSTFAAALLERPAEAVKGPIPATEQPGRDKLTQQSSSASSQSDVEPTPDADFIRSGKGTVEVMRGIEARQKRARHDSVIGTSSSRQHGEIHAVSVNRSLNQRETGVRGAR
jgi:hypothetical protein